MPPISDQKIPLSLYIHLPWCRRKCPYCDFNSYPAPEILPEKEYIAVLIRDLKNELTKINHRNLHSIFIGGGTPSLFNATAIAELLQNIDNIIPFSQQIEITMEVNPCSITKSKLKLLRSAGINRLSIGVQSLQDDKLAAIGRIHTAKETIQAVTTAQETGFNNINLDLMYGLPNQTIADALSDLNAALALEPTHLSWYQLTLEPNTAFYRKPPALPDDDILWSMQQQGQKLINAANFKQYEVSAYAKANYCCQHNLNYWQFGDYIGIGAGAHSKITTNDQIIRIKKYRHPKTYLDKCTEAKTAISQEDLALEFMLNALRLSAPIATELFTQRTGLPIAAIALQLNQAKDSGFLDWDQEIIITTDLGKKFLNQLLLLFMPATM